MNKHLMKDVWSRVLHLATEELQHGQQKCELLWTCTNNCLNPAQEEPLSRGLETNAQIIPSLPSLLRLPTKALIMVVVWALPKGEHSTLDCSLLLARFKTQQIKEDEKSTLPSTECPGLAGLGWAQKSPHQKTVLAAFTF